MSPVLVLGAGPAGLAISACLRQEGVPLRLVDREGLVGGAYRWLYPGITMASPARWTSLPGLAVDHPQEYITVPDYLRYLERYASHHGLLPEKATVLAVSRESGGFRVQLAAQEEPENYRVVVAATGLDTPVWPELPGLRQAPALHSRDWRGPEPHRAGSLLILGAGTSAVEIAEECARAGMRPVVSARRGRVDTSPQRFLGRDVHDFAFRLAWLPRWLLGSYCRKSPTFSGTDLGFRRFCQLGQIQVRGPVTRFEGSTAFFAQGPPQAFDAVVVAAGYRWEMPYLPPEVTRSQDGGFPLADRGQSRAWPGLYIMGVHCSRGVSSQFLRGMALDAPALARSIRKRLQQA